MWQHTRPPSLTVKLLLNAVISDVDAKFMTADISDFYLHSDLTEPEFMWVPLANVPTAIQIKYNVAKFARGDRVMMQINKGVYGLPQAGLLAQEKLIKILNKHGYFQTDNTKALFKHITRDIYFSLIVDDFGVKYKLRADAEHLLDALRSEYAITVDWSGSNYIGLHMLWDYDNRTVQLSMPNYIRKAIARFGLEADFKPAHSPAAFQQPIYGQQGPQLTDAPDTSPLLDAAGINRLQALVGTFLYIGRALDYTQLVQLGRLGTQQSKPTKLTEAAAHHFLRYVATWPDAMLVFHASDMVLKVSSDASYLSEPNARSRAGGYHYLGFNDSSRDTDPPNAAIHVHCSLFDVVHSSAAEAEYAACFLNAKEAEEFRNTLADLGYPQKATVIAVDNSCAVGLANDTVKQRRSKAIDMRYHWVRDRVKQGHFIVQWESGKSNLADYFTKIHPPKFHRERRSLYVRDPIRSVK
jgi:Reverse transcriptase (RNA-dependent DNA polymerase)